MAKERKSPQEKKQDHYSKDHFTFGWHSQKSFRKGWKRKKALVNRKYRSKSDEILVPAKAGVTAEDVESIGDDLTAQRFEKSVLRKRLHKQGTVTLGQKIKLKQEKREALVGRRSRRDQRYDDAATLAVNTLCSLVGEDLASAAASAVLLLEEDRLEFKRVLSSKTPADRALYSLYQLAAGSTWECEALKRNRELEKALGSWVEKAIVIARRETEKRKTRKEGIAKKRKALRLSKSS